MIWKIEPFELLSTDRTSANKKIVGIEVSYYGKVEVRDDVFSPVKLVIDYYDANGVVQTFLQDTISDAAVCQKLTSIGLSGDELSIHFKQIMDKIVKNFIGGVTKAERCAALAELAQMFGQVVLAEEYQTGVIEM